MHQDIQESATEALHEYRDKGSQSDPIKVPNLSQKDAGQVKDSEDEELMRRMLKVMQQTVDVYTEINMDTGNYRQLNVGEHNFFSAEYTGKYADAYEHVCEQDIWEEDVTEIEKIFSWESLSKYTDDVNGPRELSLRYRIKNHLSTIIMESRAMFIRDEVPRYVLVTARDVTEETETLRNALDAARAASHAKTSFLENMSHDLRTPMNAILGMTELAEGHFDEPDRMKSYIRVIRDSSKQLMSIINEILDMAKIESGSVRFHDEAYDISEALREGIEPYRKTAKKKGQSFTVDYGEIHSPYIVGDRSKLDQVLGSLIDNAIKFTPSEGNIHVDIHELQSWNDTIMNLHVTVTNDGQQIGEEQISKIFEPFYRGDAAKSQQTEGIGLGLAIAQNIVQARGGRIFAQNIENGGVSFTFDIPIRINPDIQIQQEKEDVFGENALDTLGVHVLLAEDNEINILVMKNILHAWGIIVEVARNGQEAYEIFNRSIDGMFAFILMDVRMPVMDGYEATRAIRESDHPQAQEIPIIALTANAFTEDISKSLSAGMDYHLSKPVDVNELKKIIRRLGVRTNEET